MIVNLQTSRRFVSSSNRVSTEHASHSRRVRPSPCRHYHLVTASSATYPHTSPPVYLPTPPSQILAPLPGAPHIALSDMSVLLEKGSLPKMNVEVRKGQPKGGNAAIFFPQGGKKIISMHASKLA